MTINDIFAAGLTDIHTPISVVVQTIDLTDSILFIIQTFKLKLSIHAIVSIDQDNVFCAVLCCACDCSDPLSICDIV
jgi:hypothetical protein